MVHWQLTSRGAELSTFGPITRALLSSYWTGAHWRATVGGAELSTVRSAHQSTPRIALTGDQRGAELSTYRSCLSERIESRIHEE